MSILRSESVLSIIVYDLLICKKMCKVHGLIPFATHRICGERYLPTESDSRERLLVGKQTLSARYLSQIVVTQHVFFEAIEIAYAIFLPAMFHSDSFGKKSVVDPVKFILAEKEFGTSLVDVFTNFPPKNANIDLLIVQKHL